MFQFRPQNGSGEDMGKTSCTIEIQAAFILSSFVTFFSGLLILFFSRLCWRALKKWRDIKGAGLLLGLVLSHSFGDRHLKRHHFHGVFRDRIEMLLSAQTFVGQVLVILVFVLSIGSLIIYFINSTDPVRSCSSYQDKTIPIDLTFNAFFSFYFGLRFLAADDKVKFWWQMNSIVDIFTIPPTFISYYLKSNWLGLRFLRALRLLELPQILQILRATRTSNSVKFSKLLAIVLSTWFTAAGFIHLILFANYVPEMVELFANKRKYTSSYEVLKGKKFIVVCGNITVDSVTAFLRNFLRHKSGEINTEIVFLGEAPPSLELETIFKCYMAYTTFVSGSALKWEDLRRVAVESAEACLIIANPFCSDLHAEDTSNIMRVLSIKNYHPQTRVIIQILQSHNKVFLPKIPTWSWIGGDNIICFAELTLGFISQGCLVPGLCTFLTSLFVEQNRKISPKWPWQKYFFNGLKNKILTQRLSDDFAGMSFPEVSRLCFVKMHLLLIAIKQKPTVHGYCGLVLNPSAQVKLHKNTLGFFIAESAKEVRRAFFYCTSCHSDVHVPELIEECSCKHKSHRFTTGATVAVKRNSLKEFPGTERQNFQESPLNFSPDAKTFPHEVQQDFSQLDSTGMFHWCKATALENVILKRSDKSKHEFQNHVVACIFGDAHSTLMGLRNFVMPLRASNYTRQELKDIVFIGSLDYLQREWRFLRNFPQIYILPGSALYSGDLHAVNIEECSMCAVLSSPSKSASSPTLADTDTIMATLAIGSLKIRCHTQTTSEPQSSRGCNGYSEKSDYRRIPILTELKNPSNIHFIEQLGGMEGDLSGTSLHLSTSFATGTVFSGSFLDSLLATAFYNYHVLELLQMLVTGGISSQLEHHLDKDKFSGVPKSYSTILSGTTRCKLGLLSLNQTILSDVQPRKTFGQLFCGSLDSIGILCLGLYRMMDEEERNPERKRFVIIRPANDFKLLPSDLVFCAIPFSTSCCKQNSSSSQLPCEIINLAPLTSKTLIDINKPPTVNPVNQTTTQPLVHSLESKIIPVSDSKQPVLTQNGSLSSQIHLGKTVEENGEENMKEISKNAFANSKSR
nr:potassium channel subfamily U member 1 isoform X4 [Equus asinus]